MLESKIKTKCKKLLEDKGWMVIHIIQCNLNGTPDTLVLRNGQAVFIEFKQPGRKPEELQAYRIEKLTQQGFQAIVATSSADIKHLL